MEWGLKKAFATEGAPVGGKKEKRCLWEKKGGINGGENAMEIEGICRKGFAPKDRKGGGHPGQKPRERMAKQETRTEKKTLLSETKQKKGLVGRGWKWRKGEGANVHEKKRTLRKAAEVHDMPWGERGVSRKTQETIGSLGPGVNK